MTKAEIVKGLVGLGLAKGDVVLLHSSLASFGRVEGGADTVIDAFLDVLGDQGTLVVPVFGKLGIITEVLKERFNAVQSCHPTAMVAAIGLQAEAICEDHWKAETAHGVDTPYTRIAALGGYICMAGVDQDRNTTLHSVEALLRLPYLKPITRIFDTPEGEITKTWPFFPGPHRDFIGLDRLLREKAGMRQMRVGDSEVRLVKSNALLEVCMAAGKEDPALVLCDNPQCADCVSQRADLRRARFDRESFALASSASLAGRYVPEMIENLRAAGIDRVELDAVQGEPVQMMNPAPLHRAIDELREAGLEITALRCSAAGDEAEALLAAALTARIPRMVMPLSADVPRHAAQAAEDGVAISFCNVCHESLLVSDALLALKAGGADAGFTFNPAAFARGGEKPFLVSYKRKLKRFIDQIDLEDCRFDGTPEALGQGNGEVKEMISILRCAHFQGLLVFGAGNRHSGTLLDAVKRLEQLLDTM
jgi:aminoglycoside 3-N-acetyltransferase